MMKNKDETTKFKDALNKIKYSSFTIPPDLPENSYESNYYIEIEKKKVELKHQTDLHNQSIENEDQNMSLRANFAKKVFWLTVFTLVFVGILITGSGIANIYYKIQFLSDNILIALLSFSGLDMLGLFSIILTYLFKRR